MPQPQTLSLDDLRPDPQNARRRTPRSAGMLGQSLRQFGAARSIVIDEDGTVLAGNGTVEAAAAAGITRVQVVDADGSTLVAVRRTGLTDDQKLGLALADNRTADLAEWDTDQLEQLAADSPDVLGDWFTADDLLDLTTDEDPPIDGQEAQEGASDDDGDPTRGQPLAIVLTPPEMRLWRQVKDRLGVTGDKTALLALAQEHLNG